jgi:hypothetical protein
MCVLTVRSGAIENVFVEIEDSQADVYCGVRWL